MSSIRRPVAYLFVNNKTDKAGFFLADKPSFLRMHTVHMYSIITIFLSLGPMYNVAQTR